MRKSSLVGFTVSTLLLVAVLLQGVSAYNVRLTYHNVNPGVIDFERPGYCADTDAGTHTFMPTTEGFNVQAHDLLRTNGGSLAATGGFSRKAICLDSKCDWQYYKGLYYWNEMTFYAGVYYQGVLKEDTSFRSDFFVNWESSYPQYWANLSYWGARQVAMTSSGTWQNVNVVTYFTDWVCETYEYTKSDTAFFPTWLNGDPITGIPAGQSQYSHCGKLIEVDSQGRLKDVQCVEKFPWWAGLIIAVIALIIVVAIIIIVWCCCCLCDRSKEEEERNRKLATTRDNPSGIPNQSELGLSRNSSARFTEDDDNERSFSRSGSVA